MYSRKFFDTYWRGNIRKEVFVAMSFAEEFDPVWHEAIKPAIEVDLEEPDKYKANRVDTRKMSSSIHTDILDGIAHATLVFADISVMAEGIWKGQRNGNVMFELGIAQTVRPETDVVVVKSDIDPITFDVNHIRVHDYAKGDLPATRRKFAILLSSALQERNREKSLRTEMLRDRLDVDCMNLMVKANQDGQFKAFKASQEWTQEDRLAARRLLDLDILRCVCPAPRDYEYEWTDFGKCCYQQPNQE